MRIFFINNLGGGFADHIEVETGTSVGQLFQQRMAARLRHIAGTKWGTRRYLDMNRLTEQQEMLTTEPETAAS